MSVYVCVLPLQTRWKRVTLQPKPQPSAAVASPHGARVHGATAILAFRTAHEREDLALANWYQTKLCLNPARVTL